MITKIRRSRDGLVLILPKSELKGMGLKICTKFRFHVEKEALIATPVTKHRALHKRQKKFVQKIHIFR